MSSNFFFPSLKLLLDEVQLVNQTDVVLSMIGDLFGKLDLMMGRPETVIIDARTEAGWRTSRQKIKGAVRENPLDPERWAGKYSTGSTLIFYCG